VPGTLRRYASGPIAKIQDNLGRFALKITGIAASGINGPQSRVKCVDFFHFKTCSRDVSDQFEGSFMLEKAQGITVSIFDVTSKKCF
jgi:hypothetical protein